MRISVPVASLPLLLFSVLTRADQQTGSSPLVHVNLPQAPDGERPISSDALETVRSLVRSHVANITAMVTEEYLKHSLSAGIGSILTNDTVGTLTTADADLLEDAKAFGKGTRKAPAHEGSVSSSEFSGSPDQLSLQDDDSAAKAKLLTPLSLPLLTIKPVVPLCSPACNCNNNPTSVCCQKVCGASVVTAEDQDESTSTLVAAGSADTHAPLPEGDSQMSTSCVCNCNNNPTSACCLKICGRAREAAISDVPNDQMPLSGESVSCVCNCNNNPTSACCLKICGRAREAAIDPQASTSTVAISDISDAQVPLSGESVSCVCNCNNNPTSACCLKICGRGREAAVDRQESTSTVAGSDALYAQGVLFGDDSQLSASCVCNCNKNPTSACCLKICGAARKAAIDLGGSTSTVAISGAPNAQEPLSGESASCVCNCNNNPTSTCCLKICGRTKETAIQRNGIGAGMVALRTSTSSFLTVQAEFDLDLYASFVSTVVVEALGLTSEVKILSKSENTKMRINNQVRQVVGAVSLTIEAYTRKSPAFESVFYVFEDGHASVNGYRPELVFGIDHVREAKGLALSPEFFA